MDLHTIASGAVIPTAVGAAACALGNLRAARSALVAPRLADQAPEMPGGRPWPRLSVIVAACNEAHTIEAATRSLLACDYPDLELVLVDDRSTDGTGAVVDRIAAGDPRVRAIHVGVLPPDWLGKVHALHCGSQAASGELLLFTDADVVFAPDALRRAVAWMERDQLDHLTLMPRMRGSLATQAASAAFATGLLLGVDTTAVGKPGSRAYIGLGAFGMVRRSTLARTEGFPWLRMEIADDTGLAMLIVREAGGRSRLGTASALVELEWYPSLAALVGGLEKNLFAVIGHFSLGRALVGLVGFVFLALSGWVAIGLGIALHRPWLFALPAFAWATQAAVALAYRRVMAHPVGATMLAPLLLFAVLWAFGRSTFATLRRGGVEWRGTFYPLAALRRARRVDL